MNIDQDIFRAYDIRGEVGPQITPEVMEQIARAYGTRLSRQLGRPALLLLGRDLRTSSEELSAAAAAGMQACGCSVLDIGACPTPVMYYAIDCWGADGGLGITASHKPPQFNGLKVRYGSGPFFGDSLQELYRETVAGDFLSGAGSYEQRDIWPEYFACAEGELHAGAAAGLKVVLDLGNGCGTFTAQHLLRFLGCELDIMFPEPDGTFPNRPPDPLTAEGIAACAARVLATGADLGIALDADGDRIAVVDHEGNMVWPDRYVAPLCREILKQGPATFVTEVRCSRSLIEDVEARGGSVKMTACGYPYILAGMAESSAPLGFETTGHCYFGNRYLKYDDASFGAARLLESIAASGQSLSETLQSLPPYFTAPEERVACSDETKFAVAERVAATYRGQAPMLEVDGARIEFPEGWALIRASNTGAELVMRWEGRTEAACDEIGRQLLDRVHEAMQYCCEK
ncbi:MAG TPA: phosphomannomutase/phosphoglucomutase [Armatimonadota bacterium]|jgi:phosphomannomutase/phosphoglucomutase